MPVLSACCPPPRGRAGLGRGPGAIAAAVLVGAALAYPAASEARGLPVAPATLGVAAPAPGVSDEIIVRHRSSASAGDRAQVRADADVALEAPLPLTGVEVVTTDGSRAEALRRLRADPDVLWAEPNQPVHVATADEFWDLQYGLENLGATGTVDADIDAESAWTVSRGAGVTVGVVDTGVDAAHPDLAGQLVTGVNFVADGHPTTADGAGHGTHVTGIIAAAENTIGIVGVAPAAKVQPLRALDDTGTGTTASVSAAYAYAGAHGLRVVNASLGSPDPSQAERQAILASPGTLFVVAAGNAGQDLDAGAAHSFPCAYDYPNVLCVGASDDNDARAGFSNVGQTSVDLFAPGADIASTYPGNDYVYASGTSMAAPMAAASAALVAAAHPTWTAAQLKAALLGSVDHPAGVAGLSVTGGRLNAARALGVDVGPDGLAPAAVQGVTATAGVGRVDLAWSPSPEADFAGYRVSRLVGGDWVVQATVQTTAIGVTGLTPGAAETFRVTALDRSGGESAPSAAVTATVRSATGDDPAAPRAGAGVDAAGASDTAPIAARRGAGTGAVATGSRRLSHLRLAAAGRALGFQLSSASPVTVTATRRRAGGAEATVVSRTLLLPAGPEQLGLDRSRRGLRLGRGTWRISLSTGTSRAGITVQVR